LKEDPAQAELRYKVQNIAAAKYYVKCQNARVLQDIVREIEVEENGGVD